MPAKSKTDPRKTQRLSCLLKTRSRYGSSVKVKALFNDQCTLRPIEIISVYPRVNAPFRVFAWFRIGFTPC